jgi:Ca2+/Na+ antiporter
MEELLKGSEPSVPRQTGIFSFLSVFLRPAGAHRDINGWYRASFWGSIACIVLYTVFGYVFVRAHALQITAEMGLLARFGMTALINPDDVHLIGLGHQLASALFFGMTLGVLNALVCMALTFPAWISGRFARQDLVAFAGAVFACIFFTFSKDMPWVSVCFGILSPLVFTFVWLFMVRKAGYKSINIKRWAIFCGIIIAPLAIIIGTGSSFLSIRDSMLSMRFTEALSNVYYEHTLLSADVIKPVSARSQNVIAFSDDIKSLGYTPHGTLWIRSDSPCLVKGATFAVSSQGLNCRSVMLPADNLSANENNRIIDELSKAIDPNKQMRGGIGFFFFSGPLIVIAALILSWFALALERVFTLSRLITFIIVIAYLSVFMPLFHGTYLLAQLKTHPEKISDYAASPVERMRYAAVATYPGALSKEDLVRLMQDPSARVRVNAVVEAGDRMDMGLLSAIEALLKDPKMNVRTKACWALGKIQSDMALNLLDKVVHEDPSWYVRDYAYASTGRIRPETKVISLIK